MKARKVKGIDPAGPLADERRAHRRRPPGRAVRLRAEGLRPRRGRGAARHAHRRQAPALRPGGDRRAVRAVRRTRRASARRSCRTCSATSTTATCSCRACSALLEDLRDRGRRRGRGRRRAGARRRLPRPRAAHRPHARAAPAAVRAASWRSGPTSSATASAARLEYAIDERPGAGGGMTTETREPRRRPPDLSSSDLYFNRELSWIEFNARVLAARRGRAPAAARAGEVRRDLRVQPRRVLHDPRRRRGGPDRRRAQRAGRRRAHAAQVLAAIRERVDELEASATRRSSARSSCPRWPTTASASCRAPTSPTTSATCSPSASSARSSRCSRRSASGSAGRSPTSRTSRCRSACCCATRRPTTARSRG